MAIPPKLSAEQKRRLLRLESSLREAVRRADYESAKRHTADLQAILRPLGQETRLMQSKNWLFEAAMEAGHLQIAVAGFIGVRGKTSSRTRVHLEATALLAICYLRQKRVEEAEPLMAEVLTSHNIKSEGRKRRFLRLILRRFEEEGLLAGLRGHGREPLDPSGIQEEAGQIVRIKTEDEILADMASALPHEAIDMLRKVDAAARRRLTAQDLRYLPPPDGFQKRSELGRTLFGSFKLVLWRSLCDPKSEVYKAWFSEGLGCFLEKKYYAVAVAAMLVDLGIGIKALGVSATALLIKFGLEVYCHRFQPEGVMSARETELPNEGMHSTAAKSAAAGDA